MAFLRMSTCRRARRPPAATWLVGALLGWPMATSAQEPQPTPPAEVHEHVVVDGAMLTPTRETSGTAWIPSATPMYGVHRPWRGWDVRVSGSVFVQALYEPRDRHRTGGAGTRQVGSLNWGMLMARRSLGGGRFGVRTMLSAEPWTVPRCGSLNFLATGDVCDGDTIHDRQQPHDLVMELPVDYERSLRGGGASMVWRGRSARGYPHRASAMPTRWTVTHLAGRDPRRRLVTLGVRQRWKAEVSAFNRAAQNDTDRPRHLRLGGGGSARSTVRAGCPPGCAG
jgi:hypothetical protein